MATETQRHRVLEIIDRLRWAQRAVPRELTTPSSAGMTPLAASNRRGNNRNRRVLFAPSRFLCASVAIGRTFFRCCRTCRWRLMLTVRLSSLCTVLVRRLGRLGRTGLGFRKRLLSNRRWNIRFRSQLCHELFELAFALVSGSCQDLFAIGLGEMFRDHGDATQVKAAILEHREKQICVISRAAVIRRYACASDKCKTSKQKRNMDGAASREKRRRASTSAICATSMASPHRDSLRASDSRTRSSSSDNAESHFNASFVVMLSYTMDFLDAQSLRVTNTIA